MRKMNIKKKATSLLSLVLVFSLILGNANLTFAAVDNRVDELGLHAERVDDANAVYNNEEHSNDASSNKMQELANTAKEKADEAAETVTGLENEVAGLEEKATAAGNAAATAEIAAEDAAAAATAADTLADSATVSGSAIVADAAEYNNEVAANQEKIDETDVNADGLTQLTTEQADTASSAAATAKELLETALTGETKDAEVELQDGSKATVEEVVEMIKEEADKAAKASEEATKEYNEAAAELEAAIAEYNKYAKMYGLPLYGETEVTYETSESTEKNTADQINNDKEEFKSLDLDTAVTVAASKCDAASSAAATAKLAADTAAEAADAAAKKLDNIDDGVHALDAAATEKAEEALNSDVTPAKNARDNAKAASDKANESLEAAKASQNKINAEQDAIISNQSTAKSNYEISLNNVNKQINGKNSEIKTAQSIIDKLEDKPFFIGASEIEKAREIMKNPYEKNRRGKRKHSDEDIRKAQDTVNQYNNAQAAKAAAVEERNTLVAQQTNLSNSISACNTAITNANNVKSAAARTVAEKTSAANQAKATLNEKQAKLDKEEQLRDARVAAAEQFLSGDDSVVTQIQQELSKLSDNVNQVEYDKSLNAWANETFSKYKNVEWSIKFWETFKEIGEVMDDARDIRSFMDDEYNASKVQEIFNYLGLTQWAVSVKEREAVMNVLINGYRESMSGYEKELASIEACEAEKIAENNEERLAEVATLITNAADTAVAAGNVIAQAESTITSAEETYKDAESRLNKIEEEVTNISLSAVDLSALQAKIDAAKAEVEAAAKAVEEAKACKEAAENYMNWATALVSDHETAAVIVVAAKEENTQDTVVEIKSIDGTKVTVPYSIYNKYVKAMYENYKMDSEGLVEKEGLGKGITSDSSDDKGSMEVIFWETVEKEDENGNKTVELTGKYLTKNQLPNATANYFVGYAFTNEVTGYQLEGSMVHIEEVKAAAPTPVQVPVVLPEVNNDEVIDAEETETPAAAPEEEEEEAAVPEEVEAEEPEEEKEEEVFDVDEAETAQGTGEEDEENDADAAEALPQTGTLPVGVFYGFGAGCVAFGGVLAIASKRKEEI